MRRSHSGGDKRIIFCLQAPQLLFSAPGHDRHGGDGVLRASFHHLRADRKIDESVVLLVEHADDLGFFEEGAGFLAKDIFLVGHFVRQRDGAGLPA